MNTVARQWELSSSGHSFSSVPASPYAPASIAARQTSRAYLRIQALCLALVVEDTLVSEDMKCSVGIRNSTA